MFTIINRSSLYLTLQINHQTLNYSPDTEESLSSSVLQMSADGSHSSANDYPDCDST